MKLTNNNISPLPFYDALSFQNHRKDYAFGQVYALITHKNMLLPFQVIIDAATDWYISSAKLINFNTGAEAYDVFASMTDNGLELKHFDDFSIIKYPGTEPIIPSSGNGFKEGRYYLQIKLSKVGSTLDAYYIYSDVFVVTNRVDDYLLLEYSNTYDLEFKNGIVDFSDNFKFKCYLDTEIGKPEYYFEEEVSERMGHSFVESQVSKKIYKFTFLAPEYLCDALRIVRLCDTKKITSREQYYDLTTFAMSSEWQEQGDIASVDCEFETDTVIANIGGYALGASPSMPGTEGFINGTIGGLLNVSSSVDDFADEPVVLLKDVGSSTWATRAVSSISGGTSYDDLYTLTILRNGVEVGKYKPDANAIINIDDIASALVLSKHIDDTDKHISENERALWNRIAGLFDVDTDGDVYVKNGKGFYTEGFISAGAKGTSGGSGSTYTQKEWAQIKEMTESASGILASAYAVKESYNELNTAIETIAGKATNVTFTQTLTSGKQIGSISIDGKSTSLFAPANYAWSEVTGKPTFATVATSGSYADLSNKPTIASLMGSAAIGGTSSFIYWNGSAFVSKALGTNAFTSISKISQLTNDSGYITGITKSMVEGVLTGDITSHTHSQYLTAHQPIYALTIQKNGTTAGTYTPNSKAATINISDVASAAALSGHTTNTTVHITANERTLWNKITGLFDVDTDGDVYVKNGKGFYTEGFISAGAKGTSGGGSSTYTQKEWAQIKDMTATASGSLASAYAVKEAYSEAKTLIDVNTGNITSLTSRVTTLEGKATAVSFSQTLTSGTKIGAITVDGTTTNIYAPTLASQMGSTAIGGTSSYLYWNGSAWATKALGSNAFTSISKVSQLTNDSGYITGITKAMVEGVLTGNITSHTHSYLPLSGGTMSNTNVVTNLNADLLDGLHKSSIFVSNFSTIQSSKLDTYATRQSGTYTVEYPGYTKTLVSFRSIGSASALELLCEYDNSNLLCRTAIDSNKFTDWKTIAFTNSNVASASKWATARTITLTGSVTGSVSIDGSQNVSLATTTNHTHTFASLTDKPTTISGYGITDGLRRVTLANNVENDFNTFENLTLTGRGDPTTGSSLLNSPWTTQPAGGFGVLTYLWSSYGLQLAAGYNSNDLYVRNKYFSAGIGAVWSKRWDKILNSSNYNSYAPKLDGTGATGTWNININGYAGALCKYINITDLNVPSWGLTDGFSINYNTCTNTVSNAPSAVNNANLIMNIQNGLHGSSGQYGWQVGFFNQLNSPYVRRWAAGNVDAWYKLLHSGNYNEFAPSLTGVGASGTWGINISGNAATLGGLPSNRYLTLDTAYYTNNTNADTLTGVSFYINTTGNGSGNSNFPTTYGKLFSWGGQYAYTQLYADVLNNGLYFRTKATAFSGEAWKKIAFTDSNVASATKLQNSRTIWGQSFDGTGNVNGALEMDGIEILDKKSNALYIGFGSAVNSGLPTYLWGKGINFINSVGNTKMLVTDEGNVGIGTTSPSYKLHIAGVAYASEGLVSDGYISAAATSTSSDIRLKDNVSEISSEMALKWLSMLKPKSWSWNSLAGVKGQSMGFVAQDVEGILPQMIRKRRGNDYLSLDYTQLHALEVSALQSHEKRIEELERENKILKEEINKLKQYAN